MDIDKRFLNWLLFTIYLGAIVSGLAIQFIWQMFLGSEIPVQITFGQFLTFAIFSMLFCVATLLYLKTIKNVIMLLVTCLVTFPVLWFWGITIVDILEHSRVGLLITIRYIGFGTTIMVELLCVLKILHKSFQFLKRVI